MSNSETSTDGGGGFSEDTPVNQRYTGGTRLKPKWVVSAEGERTWNGWLIWPSGVKNAVKMSM